MEVRIWQSFSCNNSSSYYLVARFETVEAASASAEELREFFLAHGRHVDAMWEQDEDPTTAPSQAARELADKHGFDWTGYLMWGDGGMVDDEPDVYAIGDSVLIYHGYCGGFGESIPKYFKAIGARAGDEDDGNPLIAITFAIPDTPKAREAAAAVGDYIDSMSETAEEEEGWVFQNYIVPPWGPGPTEDMEFECGVPFPGWHDGHTVGLVLEVPQTEQWEVIRDYLLGHDIVDHRLTVDAPGIVERYRAIAGASCRECGTAPLRFIDATVHGTPDDQLACESCGGMFEIGEFLEEK